MLNSKPEENFSPDIKQGLNLYLLEETNVSQDKSTDVMPALFAALSFPFVPAKLIIRYIQYMTGIKYHMIHKEFQQLLFKMHPFLKCQIAR